MSALGPDWREAAPPHCMGPSWFPRLPPPRLLLTPRRPLEGSPLGPSSLEGLLPPHFLSERPGDPPSSPQVLSTLRPPAPSTASPLQTEPVAAVDTDVHRDPLSSSGGPLHPAPPPGPPSSPSCAPALRAAHPILLVIPLSADPQQFYLLGSLRASPPGPSELSLNWHPCRCLLGR